VVAFRVLLFTSDTVALPPASTVKFLTLHCTVPLTKVVFDVQHAEYSRELASGSPAGAKVHAKEELST
jgi:hypothetical protein